MFFLFLFILHFCQRRRNKRIFFNYPFSLSMNNVLKVSRINFQFRLFLFVLASVGFIFSLYVSYLRDSPSLFIEVGLASFILPWSFFSALSEWDKSKKQFQLLSIEKDHLLFAHLPIQGGTAANAQIDFKNIESVHIKMTSIHILFVRRYEWEGAQCEFITPSGFVPKLQVFSLTINKRKRLEILDLLHSKGIKLKGKS